MHFPRILAVVIFGVSLLLVVTAFPSFMARFELLSGDALVQEALAGDDLSDADLVVVKRSREAALRYRNFPEAWDDLAFSLMLSDSFEADAAMRLLAQRFQERSLLLAPLNAYGWSRLSFFIAKTEGVSEAAMMALDASYKADRYDERLARLRLDLAMRVWDTLTPETKKIMPDVIRSFWQVRPVWLAYAAHEGFYVSVVRQALRKDPIALDAFNVMIQKIRAL